MPTSASLWLLVGGVAWPAGVIAFEAATRMCANALFDPMPTTGHVVLLAQVPASNLLAWLWLAGLAGVSSVGGRLIAALNGAAVAIAACYALLFLPLLPLALLAVLIGIGLAPLAPFAALLSAIALKARVGHRLQASGGRGRPAWWSGLAAAFAALVALDLPAAVTRHGVGLAASSSPEARVRGVALLRTWGSHDVLLALASGTAHRAAGPLSFLISLDQADLFRTRPQPQVSVAQAREIYYRVTGHAFAATPRPGSALLATARTFDGDRGGSQVGSSVPGLVLGASRLDGVIAADDAVAYIEWLLEVRNDSDLMQEARLTLALPPGGVVSRVTLWVNGVEEEAAFAGRGKVRAAYERIVRRSQDPLLVTTNGADRVLAQAFPVPPRGGTMRFRIGITAPLELEGRDRARLVLPAIIDRNFGAGGTMRHAVWLDSGRPLATTSPGLDSTSLAGGGTRVTGELPDETLARARPVIAVARDPAPAIARANNPETGTALQEILAAPVAADRVLMLVVDGSARTRPHVGQILAALEALPQDFPVGLAIAAERSRVIGPAPWSAALKAEIAAALLTEPYDGGIDNTEALALAMGRLGDAAGARVLWVHGPQPVVFAATKGRLEQVAARLRQPPALSLYALEPGPNVLFADLPWKALMRAIPGTGDVSADLTRALQRMTGQDLVPGVRRTLVERPGLASEPHMPEPVVPSRPGSDHIVRLAAYDEVLALLRRGGPRAREAAVDLAGLHRLVTPVSGAVVLETQQQYRDAGLAQGMKGLKGNVPTVPEPHEWALMLMAAAALGAMLWRRRARHPAGLSGAV